MTARKYAASVQSETVWGIRLPDGNMLPHRYSPNTSSAFALTLSDGTIQGYRELRDARERFEELHKEARAIGTAAAYEQGAYLVTYDVICTVYETDADRYGEECPF